MFRHERINDELQHILSETLSQRIEVPLDFLATVTEVDCAPDMKTAKIYLSILPFAKAEEGLKWFINTRGLIQKELGRKFRHRKATPILRFILDDREETASQIYNMIDSL